ncbi:unnamed protein product [Prorocentrum cordatum]|uniref:Calmodulin n=1 Tax=Prorocentrum cordatum TaxID=2364126 RepID=A0ABN9SGV8_9DINO|nr:unnamed protein product [Polarella glacialis]
MGAAACRRCEAPSHCMAVEGGRGAPGELGVTPSARGRGDLDAVRQRIECLVSDLFRLHDLNGNGVLEEAELIQLNEQIAYLHHGPEVDLEGVRSDYAAVFRLIAPDGEPVSQYSFSRYTHKVLNGMDEDPVAQEMILEQWIAEAQACREAFASEGPAAWAGRGRLSCGGPRGLGATGLAGAGADEKWASSMSEPDTCAGASDNILSDSDAVLDSPGHTQALVSGPRQPATPEAMAHTGYL